MGDLGAASIRSGVRDEAAFWRLYEDALPHVYGYLLRRSERAVAEDLTQEVFLTAARALRSGRGEVLTVPWLLTVARSRLVDHIRATERAQRKLALAWSAQAVDDDVADPVGQSPLDARSLSPETEAALAALPPTQRAVLVLHHLDGLSVAEIADAIGRSVRATESLLARARRMFRTAFQEAAGG